jgi:hypothetical protein
VAQFRAALSVRLVYRHFGRWKRLYDTKQIARENEILVHEAKQEQLKLVRAARFERCNLMSKALIEWKRYVAEEKETRMLRALHQQRQKQMEVLLENISAKLKSVDSKPLQEEIPKEKPKTKLQMKSPVPKTTRIKVKDIEPNASLEPEKECNVQPPRSNRAKINLKTSQVTIDITARNIARKEAFKQAAIARQALKEQLLQKQEQEKLEKEAQLQEQIQQERLRLEQEASKLLEQTKLQKKLAADKQKIARDYYNRNLHKSLILILQLHVKQQKQSARDAHEKYQRSLTRAMFDLWMQKTNKKQAIVNAAADLIFLKQSAKQFFKQTALV